jgi:hypothetical protein
LTNRVFVLTLQIEDMERTPRAGRREESLRVNTPTDRTDYVSNARAAIASAGHGARRLIDRLPVRIPWLVKEGRSDPTSSPAGDEHPRRDPPEIREVVDALRPRFKWSADLVLLVLVALAVGITFGRPGGEEAPAVAEAVPRLSAPVRNALALVAVTAKSISRPVGSEVELAVRVSGERGRPVVDRTVVWRVLDGNGGVLGAAAVRTDAQGVAWNSLRLPEETGSVTVVAGADGTDLPEVRFEVVVLPRNP